MLLRYTPQLTAASGNFAAPASSGQLIGANNNRSALRVDLDSAATAPVYLLLGTGTASATNWHVKLSAGQVWDGTLGNCVLWIGAVQYISTVAGRTGVAEC